MQTLTHIIVRVDEELWAIPSSRAHSTHYVDNLARIPFSPQCPWGGMGLIEGQAHVIISFRGYVQGHAGQSVPRAMNGHSWLILLEPASWRVCLGVDRIVGYAESLVVRQDSTQNTKAKFKSHWKGAPICVLDVESLLSAFNLSEEPATHAPTSG